MGKNKKKADHDVSENKREVVENLEEEKELKEEKTTDEVSPSADGEFEKKLIDLEQEIENLKDKNLRMMAEFDNFRRRTNKEKLELMTTAGETIFKEMLPLIDDFERAIKASLDVQNEGIKQLQNGIELIYNKFKGFLSEHGITEIETEDVPFSTDLHEALTTVDAGEDKQGKIIECTRKGYKMGEKVIRYAQVVVGK